MNLLEVRYDDDGTKHYFRDGEEISESAWLQQHPHMRKGNTGDGNPDGGQLGQPGDRKARFRAYREAQAAEGQ